MLHAIPHFRIIFICLLTCLALPTTAAPCTYSEALLAYQMDNVVRGTALMTMAARDGDQRAVDYLRRELIAQNKPNTAHESSLRSIQHLTAIMTMANN